MDTQIRIADRMGYLRGQHRSPLQHAAAAIRVEQELIEQSDAQAREMRGYRIMAAIAKIDFDQAFADLAPSLAQQEVRVDSDADLAEALDGTSLQGQPVATRYEAATEDVPQSAADFMSLLAGLTEGPQTTNAATVISEIDANAEWGAAV